MLCSCYVSPDQKLVILRLCGWLEAGKKLRLHSHVPIFLLRRPSLLHALVSSFGRYFGLAGLLKLAHDISQLLSPVLVRAIIQFLKQPTKPLSQGVQLAALLLLANVLQTVCNQHYLLRVFRTGLRVRETSLPQSLLRCLDASCKAICLLALVVCER